MVRKFEQLTDQRCIKSAVKKGAKKGTKKGAKKGAKTGAKKCTKLWQQKSFNFGSNFCPKIMFQNCYKIRPKSLPISVPKLVTK